MAGVICFIPTWGTSDIITLGRPCLKFGDCSEGSKRLKTADLRKSNTTEELVYATQMSLRSTGNVTASNILKTISSDPEKAIEYKEAMKTVSKNKTKFMSKNGILATFVDAQLSKHQYDVIRKRAPDIFPSYKIIQKAKTMCYPQNISSNETCVQVRLQDLLNHTVDRLLKTSLPILGDLLAEELQSPLSLVTK